METILFALTNGLIWGCVMALIALGLSLIFGIMGIVNMAHGEFFMAGAVLTLVLLPVTGNFWLSVLLAALAVALAGGLLERYVLRPFEGRPMASMVATVGLSFAMQQLALMIFGGTPRFVPDPWPVVVRIFGVGFPGYRLLLAVLAVALVCSLWLLLYRTRLGLTMRACMQNQEIASALGINSSRIAVLTFGLGAFLAAVGGALAAPVSQVFFLMGNDVILFAFIAVIVGGLGSLEGTLLAAVLLSTLEGLLSVWLAPTQARALIFLGMAVVLVLRPQGLFGQRVAYGAAARAGSDLPGDGASDSGGVRQSKGLIKSGTVSGRLRLWHTAAAAVGIVLAALAPLLPQAVTSLVIVILIYAIYALAYELVFGLSNQPSLGQSLFWGLGAYGAVLAILHLGWGLWASLATGTLAALLVGAIAGLVVVRLNEAYYVIATAIFASVLQLLARNMTELTGGTNGINFTIPDLAVGWLHLSLYDPLTNYYFVLIVAGLAYTVVGVLSSSRLGRVWIGMRENEGRMPFLGYRVEVYKLAAFVLAAALTGLAGSLYAARLRYVNSELFGLQWAVLPIVWSILGGRGTLFGPVLAVAILALFEFYISAFFSNYLLIVGLLLIAILRWSQQGIAGAVRSVYVRVQGWAHAKFE
jgi:ABC-type branched-subunit amino acid transport system permease subunit